jgi:glycine/D-amino acid oxidase-like deaminating enzyme
MVADEAREVERDGHAGFADVACRRSGDLVKAIDDGVAVNGESLCGQDEVEPAFAPGDSVSHRPSKSFSRCRRASCEDVNRARARALAVGNQLFPGAIDWDMARYRTGLRPMTPDGPPLIGLGQHSNLYYNTGHGHVGWTMACGSARILADLVDERQPDIDPTPYSPITSNRHR